jgi:hypothetical protein
MNAEEPVHVQSELAWFKSIYSSNEGGACVEVAAGIDAVYVRDSKDRQGPQLAFGRGEWSEFLRHTAER